MLDGPGKGAVQRRSGLPAGRFKHTALHQAHGPGVSTQSLQRREGGREGGRERGRGGEDEGSRAGFVQHEKCAKEASLDFSRPEGSPKGSFREPVVPTKGGVFKHTEAFLLLLVPFQAIFEASSLQNHPSEALLPSQNHPSEALLPSTQKPLKATLKPPLLSLSPPAEPALRQTAPSLDRPFRQNKTTKGTEQNQTESVPETQYFGSTWKVLKTEDEHSGKARSNAIILDNSVSADCLEKVVRTKTEEILYEKTH